MLQAELILMKNALELILPKLAKVIYNLRSFALEWKDEPTLGYTVRFRLRYKAPTGIDTLC